MLLVKILFLEAEIVKVSALITDPAVVVNTPVLSDQTEYPIKTLAGLLGFAAMLCIYFYITSSAGTGATPGVSGGLNQIPGSDCASNTLDVVSSTGTLVSDSDSASNTLDVISSTGTLASGSNSASNTVDFVSSTFISLDNFSYLGPGIGNFDYLPDLSHLLNAPSRGLTTHPLARATSELELGLNDVAPFLDAAKDLGSGGL